MAVTAITRDQGVNVNIVRVTATDTLAEVAASGYVTEQTENIKALNSGTWQWQASDSILIHCADGNGLYEFDGGDFTTFAPMAEGNGNVALPVTDGNFSVFDGTLGGMHDLGYSPSDPTKTKVIMADGAVVVNDILVAADTSGTLKSSTGVIAALNGTLWVKGASITVGNTGTGGSFISLPTGASKGSLRLVAANNDAANVNSIIQNGQVSQATTYTLPVLSGATGTLTAAPSALVNNNLVKATGTGGIADTGYAIKAINGAVALGGSATQSFSEPFCTELSVVIGAWVTSANAVSIQKIVPGVASFDVISSGDAGAGTFSYVVINGAGV